MQTKKSRVFPVLQGKKWLRAGMYMVSFVFLVGVLGMFSSFAAQAAELKGKTLIVYYSWSGNTREVVKSIQKTIDADVVELQTVTPYPTAYRSTTAQAKKEQESGFRPPLSTKIDNLNEYDNIIIGSPNWWGTLSMPMFTFFDTYDLSGKNLAVFITHGGSRLGRAMDDVKKLAPNAHLLEALAISDSNVRSSQEDVNEWLQKIGLTQ